jgi:hypothetical protein
MANSAVITIWIIFGDGRGQYSKPTRAQVQPGVSIVIATATYAATLVGAGRAHTQFNSTNFMEVTVRAAGGTPLQVIGKNFSVACNENSLFIISAEIDPGQFDLIGGATWSNTFNFIQPC